MTVVREKKLPIYYPSSDGKPMADNTVQFNWLVKIKQGLEETTEHQNIFVAGDLLWYPVEGNNKLRLAPDVMVAVGRPKGDRGSYLQWKEGNIPPQIVIEILSPGNRRKEMDKKLAFYEKYGVKEYIIYNPQKNILSLYQRNKDKLVALSNDTKKWTSSVLGFHLHLTNDNLEIFHPDGQPFKTNLEQIAEKKIALQKAEIANQKAEIANQKAEKERQEKLLLLQKLRELGVDTDEILGK